ncbi:uncharacterized protein L201_004096 [Kwoniella dendrophila CBS 6074]|uniref:PAS domain-containing protein n=1 Tax=Kwoniella dendrophila CBS 6074 TaxID=1295534 RepID=A0AAX4JW89_9TREE
MSTNTQRPAPAPIHNHTENNNGQPSSSASSSNIPRNQQAPQNAQSPLDWANFMNFQTPPVNNQPAQSYQHRMPSQDDQYSNFAHGISMSRPSPSSINFQQPLPRGSTSSTASSHQNPNRQYSTSSASSQPQIPTYHVPSQTPPNPQSPPGKAIVGKGKSPATKPSETQDNGLSLDPSAFSRDIRFQVPSFLTNQVGGAPTFPPGGEAWSGFTGANLFGSDVGQLTPGTIFSNAFGITHTATDNQQQYCDNNGNMQNMSYGNDNGGWEQWNHEQQTKNDNTQNHQNNNHLNSAMFYVNPNPSPNILASRNAPARDQSHRTPRMQMTAPINTNVQNQGQMPSPRTSYPQSSTSSGSMPTSAILPQQPAFPQAAFANYDNVPSASAPHNSASTVNIASSSTAPYAPPSNTQSLLTGPMPPQLADGPGLYSTTGFDMVGVLARVAARRDPSTVLGPVDLSCSFLVVDIRRYDSPIVYASPSFSQLTGYDLSQILGRNCRFLQAPDGEVVKGSKRKYTDNTAVAHLKRMLNAGKECQASLINYRRGGVPFINLVTVVPIPWEGTDIVYHVGFQVDLVEQPNAILRNMRDGSYQVNYTVSNPPEKPLRPPAREIGGITGLSGEVMEIMGQRVNTLSGGSGEEAGRMEWLKMVLDNTDDFVHALSLKGFFQYVSPSVRRVLEYEPEELLNKNISEFAHPSDIVPLMRELKDSTHAPSDGSSARHVNLVFRIRRKTSGYIWIESVGRLVVEAGKGRKAVILSGRARAVPALPWDSIAKYGGLAEREFWGKISFQGLILNTTQGVEGVLGQPSDDLIGQSFFSLLPGGDNGPPPAALLQADPSAPVSSLSAAIRRVLHGDTRNGAVSIQHKLVHKSGNQVDVITVIYAPRRSIPDVPLGRDDETSSNGESETSRNSSHDMASITGIPPTSLVIQVKLVVSSISGNSIQAMTRARPVVHAPVSNLFEELETTRGTSWQYELHQLRLLNRRLKEDIAAAKARGAGKTKNRKRKYESGIGEMGPPALPYNNLHEQYTAAPRHQLAPGFGLVTPGMGNSFY